MQGLDAGLTYKAMPKIILEGVQHEPPRRGPVVLATVKGYAAARQVSTPTLPAATAMELEEDVPAQCGMGLLAVMMLASSCTLLDGGWQRATVAALRVWRRLQRPHADLAPALARFQAAQEAGILLREPSGVLDPEAPELVVLQFGKAAKDEYILDYGYPLTPLQARPSPEPRPEP